MDSALKALSAQPALRPSADSSHQSNGRLTVPTCGTGRAGGGRSEICTPPGEEESSSSSPTLLPSPPPMLSARPPPGMPIVVRRQPAVRKTEEGGEESRQGAEGADHGAAASQETQGGVTGGVSEVDGPACSEGSSDVHMPEAAHGGVKAEPVGGGEGGGKESGVSGDAILALLLLSNASDDDEEAQEGGGGGDGDNDDSNGCEETDGEAMEGADGADSWPASRCASAKSARSPTRTPSLRRRLHTSLASADRRASHKPAGMENFLGKAGEATARRSSMGRPLKRTRLQEDFIDDLAASAETMLPGGRAGKGAEHKHPQLDDSNHARGNYKCGRCGKPKKGHVCVDGMPYESRGTHKEGDAENKTAARAEKKGKSVAGAPVVMAKLYQEAMMHKGAGAGAAVGPKSNGEARPPIVLPSAPTFIHDTLALNAAKKASPTQRSPCNVACALFLAGCSSK